MFSSKLRAMKCPHCGKSIPESVIASHMGKRSAKKLSKVRNSAFFSKMSHMRKKKSGGRPSSKKNS